MTRIVYRSGLWPKEHPNAAIRVGPWKLLVDCFNYTLMAPTGQVSLYNITCE